MKRTKKQKIYIAAATVALLAVTGVGIAATTQRGDDNGPPAASGTIDDGAELLPQARLTVEQAIATAQQAVAGESGEVDLEYYGDSLVFNVDVGDRDVKVDAQTGAVLASDHDD